MNVGLEKCEICPDKDQINCPLLELRKSSAETEILQKLWNTLRGFVPINGKLPLTKTQQDNIDFQRELEFQTNKTQKTLGNLIEFETMMSENDMEADPVEQLNSTERRNVAACALLQSRELELVANETLDKLDYGIVNNVWNQLRKTQDRTKYLEKLVIQCCNSTPEVRPLER